MPNRRPKRKSVDDVYEMEEITAYKQEKNTDFFRIKWKNYGEADSTWEPKKNIINPDDRQKDRMRILKLEWATNHSPSSHTLSKAYDDDDGVVGGEEAEEMDEDEEEGTERKGTNGNLEGKLISPVDFLSAGSFSESYAKKDSPFKGRLRSRRILEQEDLCDVNHSDPIRAETPVYAEKEASLPKVARIREMTGSIFVQMRLPSEDNNSSTMSKWLSLPEARANYSEELLVFLLSRVRFRKKMAGALD